MRFVIAGKWGDSLRLRDKTTSCSIERCVLWRGRDGDGTGKWELGGGGRERDEPAASQMNMKYPFRYKCACVVLRLMYYNTSTGSTDDETTQLLESLSFRYVNRGTKLPESWSPFRNHKVKKKTEVMTSSISVKMVFNDAFKQYRLFNLKSSGLWRRVVSW
jgi:hypothetical protein